MAKATGFRVLMGFVAACAASVAVGFTAGCFYAIRMETGYIADFLRAAVSGSKDALGVTFFVGATVAIAAAAIALLSAVFIALPLYLISRRHRHPTLWQHLLAGLGIGVVVSGILLTLQHLFHNFPETEGWFEVAAIIVAGPVATLTFWAVTRPAPVSRNRADDSDAKRQRGVSSGIGGSSPAP
jgi:hypothetical protein